MQEAERVHIRKTLEQANWVIAGPRGAAVRLGMKRSTVYFRMRKLGISRDVAAGRKEKMFERSAAPWRTH
jgi:transcriptional regulator with GAF, ATPase, and Fis domain